MTTEEGEYPSVREALTDDDKVANLYCGLKWILWQISHVALGIATVVIGIPVAIVVGIVVGIVILIGEGAELLANRLEDRYGEKTKRVTDKASGVKETPVVRRVYNECPVSLTMNPRWWDRLTGWLDSKL